MIMAKQVTCPSCEGSKVITMTMGSVLKNPIAGREESEPKSTTIKCVTCNGTGKVSPAMAQMLQEEMAMWCQCDNPSEQADFYDDGEHPELHKHHYRCQNCKGVVQIG